MRVRKNVWGGIFVATIVFTAALVADITLNKGLNASFIYTKIVTVVPAEVLYSAVLTLPLIATISGIMFLRYFVKSRKHRTARVA